MPNAGVWPIATAMLINAGHNTQILIAKIRL